MSSSRPLVDICLSWQRHLVVRPSKRLVPLQEHIVYSSFPLPTRTHHSISVYVIIYHLSIHLSTVIYLSIVESFNPSTYPSINHFEPQLVDQVLCHRNGMLACEDPAVSDFSHLPRSKAAPLLIFDSFRRRAGRHRSLLPAATVPPSKQPMTNGVTQLYPNTKQGQQGPLLKNCPEFVHPNNYRFPFLRFSVHSLPVSIQEAVHTTVNLI